MLGIDDDDDIDIFSKDETLMNYYKEQNGPENETIYQFYSRSYQKLCNRIVAPERYKYDQATELHLEDYKHHEYDVYARGCTLHMCHWEPNATFASNSKSASVIDDSTKDEHQCTPLCIVYFHTNMRSLVDAKEVAPIAKPLNAHIVSFDLPGCGKSEGQLGGNLDLDMEIILDWVQALIHPSVQMIIWARGMSTAPTITLLRRLSIAQLSYQQEQRPLQAPPSSSSSSLASLDSSSRGSHCHKPQTINQTATPKSSTSHSNNSKKGNSSKIKKLDDFNIIVAVLDSPFTSIEDMVQHGLEQFQGRGFSFTKTLLSFLIHRTLTHISKQLQGFDLFSVRPIDEVADIVCPVCIVSASCDDYVPIQQGQLIAAQWGLRVPLSFFPIEYRYRQHLVEYHIFEEVTCKHFDPRPSSVTLLTQSFLQHQITRAAATSIAVSTVEETIESLDSLSQHPTASTPSVKKSGSSMSIGSLVAKGADISDSDIMDLTELENIAISIDAEVALKQQQNIRSAPTTPQTSAQKLVFSSSATSLRTMTTALSQSPWWSFSGRFSSATATPTAMPAATTSPPSIDARSADINTDSTVQQQHTSSNST